MSSPANPLQQIKVAEIKQNPENPRLVFREEEMNELMKSIREVGVKVPISVYPDGSKYVLIDGERRWRCSKRLNLKEIPGVVQPKPSRLENLLMMFNIHNVRLDWDLMPMALKLGEIRDMLKTAGKAHDAKALSGITGVRLPSVERALELLDLPKRYQTMLLKEAGKPRSEQRIKPDLFIEIYKSLHAIERHVPEVFDEVKKPEYIDSMVKKYLRGTVSNVVGFRDVTKIARANKAGVAKAVAVPALIRLVRKKGYGITDAYHETVEAAYEQRDLASRAKALAKRLSLIRSRSALGQDAREALELLRSEINRIIGRQ